MTVDNILESGSGFYPSRSNAEAHAAQLQAEGSQSRIEENHFHIGRRERTMFVVMLEADE